MNLFTYEKRRSIQSYLFERYLGLAMRNTKRGYSTIENTTRFVTETGEENIKPYAIGKVKLHSEVKDEMLENMKVFTINDRGSSKQKVILYIHGGAWVNQPVSFHWKFMDKMAQSLNAKIIAPIYPKVPHFNYSHTYPKLLEIYQDQLSSVENSQQLTIMGDSSGGNIALGLAQLLKEHDIPQPKDIILLSACVDMCLDNPQIADYERKDPMLSAGGMEVITKKWAADKNLQDPLISPIYGDLKGLAKISHFIGTHEGLYPDALKLAEKLTSEGIEHNTYVYPKMNHVFVVMPVPEARDAHQKIIHIINY
ncbi:alpha/beta hydrolase fold domain-containing protein [Rossellomorea aquimaris]|uniref:Alpha/beta hydrolase n=1 Tax=Rossellomorea aquimaris TaxID=189382 RepID=A0A5D4TJI1_9BACI|nr:alpha/beta hydrolase [Rossellomorea aquimaris]TYS75485.1 alpha/beta hydrolase [Rossellomorea aquimaris]